MLLKENIMLKNAFILSSAAIISKILGAFYQAFLYRSVGPEGIALYMRGMNVYTILLSISSAGIPIAISKLMAEEIAKGFSDIAYKLFKISFVILSITGLIFSFGLYFLSSFIADIIFESPITWIIQALAPAIFIVTIMGAIRGFFQGQQNMIPTAYSQITEQIIRILFSVIITIFYLNTINTSPINDIINGVALGPFIGSLAGLILLFYFYRNNKNKLSLEIIYKNKILKLNNKTGELTKRILLFALPATIAALLPTLIDFTDMIIIPRILKSLGFLIKDADRLLGYFSGAVLTLINIITLIASSFAISLVPSIADAKARNALDELKNKTIFSTKIVTLISIPISFFMYFFGKIILEIIFGAGDAVNILKFGSFMILFMSIYHSTTGILQGIGRTYIPLFSLSIGLIINIFCLNILINMVDINIIGASLSHTIAFFFAATINYLFCKRSINFKMEWNKWIIQTLISSILSIIISINIYKFINYILNNIVQGIANNLICLMISLIINIFSYFIFLILFKVLKEEEIKNIPKLGCIFKKIYKKK